ncbi:hypothetical protein ABZX85_37860 [Streptomyces sp. NPDC004539]|uniref:hypothetical protein n=1 Tax=Streptomyces sp. NPDC004539 TaxID=3154280 RepID=UPI0033B977C5
MSEQTWAAPAGMVHLSVRLADLHRRQDSWYGWVRASALAHLAATPEAAAALNSLRGFLPDSPENRRLEVMLRERPEDFGAAGEPLVLWAEHIAPRVHPDNSRMTFQLEGLECVNGFQTLCLIARLALELPPGHLDRAFARIDIETGPPEEKKRLRRLHYESHLYANAIRPQDNLARCEHLARIAAQYRQDGIRFDCRRGIIAGPHLANDHGIATVFRALACLHPSSGPELIHTVRTPEGLDTVWADLDGTRYRSLIHGAVDALGVQRAVETYTTALEVIARSDTSSVRAHQHLVRYAPDLIVWAAGRRLPLHELHVNGRHPFNWGAVKQDEGFHRTVKAVVKDAVDAYAAMYPKDGSRQRKYKDELERFDVWSAIAEQLSRWARL